LSRHEHLPAPGGDRRDQPADLAATRSAAAATTIAGLHTSVQAVFGWSGEYLHRFVIGGTEYGISYLGGPGFRDGARKVRLADLRLREGERSFCKYNFFAAWRVDLRVEQIACAQPGRPYARCTGGRRAGPPEDWDGPWAYLAQTQPYLVLDAITHAAQIMCLLQAAGHDDLADADADREELTALMPLLGLERFDRRACHCGRYLTAAARPAQSGIVSVTGTVAEVPARTAAGSW
jgi:hypothetical protein